MFTVPQFKNYVPLTKLEILKLRDGSFRGERLYVYADLGPTRGYATFFVKVRNRLVFEKTHQSLDAKFLQLG